MVLISDRASCFVPFTLLPSEVAIGASRNLSFLDVELRTRGLTGHGAASPATEDMMLPVSKG